MMQTRSTRHTIDYWIHIHHHVHLCRFPLWLRVNAQTGLLSVPQCFSYGIILSYKLNNQSERVGLVANVQTLALAAGNTKHQDWLVTLTDSQTALLVQNINLLITANTVDEFEA